MPGVPPVWGISTLLRDTVGHLTWGTAEGTNPFGEPFGELDGILNGRPLWVYVTDLTYAREYTEQGQGDRQRRFLWDRCISNIKSR